MENAGTNCFKLFCGLFKLKKPTINLSVSEATPGSANVKKLEDRFVYKRGKEISRSNMTQVFEGFTAKGEIIVVKKFQVPPDLEIQNICNVLKKLIDRTKEFDHPNLVKYIGSEYISEKGEFYIFTEFVPSNYESIINLVRGEQPIRFFVYQILKVLKFLNDKGFKRIGNIKPSNLLMESNMIVKLRDYVGKDYFNIIKKLSGESTLVEKPAKHCNDDLRDISKLIFNLVQKIKLSENCLDFLKVLDKLSYRDEIDFETLFRHSFLQIAKSGSNPNFPSLDNFALPNTPTSLQMLERFPELPLKNNDQLRAVPAQNEASIHKQVDLWKELPSLQKVTFKLAKLQKANQGPLKSAQKLPTKNFSPSPKSSRISKYQNDSNINENVSKLSNYLQRQNSIIRRMQAQIALRNSSILPDDGPSSLRNNSEPFELLSLPELQRTLLELNSSQLQTELLRQADYIKQLEGELRRRKQPFNRPGRVPQKSFKNVKKSINNHTVNNNFIINHIYSDDRSKNFEKSENLDLSKKNANSENSVVEISKDRKMPRAIEQRKVAQLDSFTPDVSDVNAVSLYQDDGNFRSEQSQRKYSDLLVGNDRNFQQVNDSR